MSRSTSRSVGRILVPAMSAAAMVGVVAVGPLAAVAGAETPVPPGGPGDVNGNGVLDSSERPDNPDLLPPRPGSPVPPGSPGDVNGNGLLDSSERPDNPDDVNGNGVLDSSETPDNPDL
ncbi:hypothetical protein [Pseudonocardia sp. KRD291]|uniref:hypothetical protein n=1 Tax=Pseudonocardia sp. KRD291 TaxID=2792007 RepID=UPI001C4A0831|nr:hypothetical protein [Pseudonocardia sp. KRD291]MBW0102704.1 hypothetical protein [Pseudonocardia sp. KRD291]